MKHKHAKPIAPHAKPVAPKKHKRAKDAAKRDHGKAIPAGGPAFGEPIGERLPYPGGFPVYLARYVVFGGGEPRVAMRFFNASEVLVTGLRLRVTERDAAGKTLAEYPLERHGLFAERGTEFAVADAPVCGTCASVEVQVQSVVSDAYEYVAEGDGVRLQYGVAPRGHEYYFEKKATYSLSKRKKNYMFLSVFAVLGAVLLAVAVAWRVGVFDAFGIWGPTEDTEQTAYFEETLSC